MLKFQKEIAKRNLKHNIELSLVSVIKAKL